MRLIFIVMFGFYLTLSVLEAGAADKDSIFQTSTITALKHGLYDGNMTFGELKTHGDFGLGTLNKLDGELVGLDGIFYQVTSDGKMHIVEDNTKTPFAVVTFFNPDQTLKIDKPTSCDQLYKLVQSELPSANLPYAIMVKGIFNFVHARSVPAQQTPYPSLGDVIKEEHKFEFNDTTGTMVGYWMPGFMKDINTTGFHFHYITTDKTTGGHVLDCDIKEAEVGVDISRNIDISLQATKDYESAVFKTGKLKFPSGKWIDMSHNFSKDTVYWPTAEEFKKQTVFDGVTDKGYFYSAYNFSAAEHGGTHIDAPVHFAEGKQSVDQIPIENMLGPAVVVDVSNTSLSNRDYEVSAKDLMDWEAVHGQIPDGAILLLNTGSARYWPDRVKYMGTDKRGPDAVGDLHFPGLSPEAAEWLVSERKIGAVGLDTPSIDYGQSVLFETHQILFEANIPAFENVNNLDLLPAKGALVIALPMKIKGGSGGPLRIIALVPDS